MDFSKTVNESGQICSYHAVYINVKNFKFVNRTISANRSGDTIKLDKSYLVRLGTEEEKVGVLIQNIVNMIHQLGFTVIAEGVERKEQVDFLREVGCFKIQGFLFDKPLPLEEFEKRLVQVTYNSIK